MKYKIKIIPAIGLFIAFILGMATDKFSFGPKATDSFSFYPPSVDFKQSTEQVLDESLADKLFDAFWKKTFHYQTFFESLDGFNITGTTSLDDTQLTLTTGAVSGNSSQVAKQPLNQGLITFSQKSRMRSAFSVNQITNQTIYLTVGNVVTGSQGYGFKIVNGTIYGVTHNGSSESTVQIQSISANEVYSIEARYNPSDKVIFFISDPTTSPDTPIREVGSLSTNLPSSTEVANANLFNFRITTNEGAAKTMNVTFFEYLQKRDVLK